ncbi:ubiquitin thiolesterase [Blastomyces dermatitidis ER-3]|uniref:Ubiquitin carboxyl-terminal hydrolase n=1 Tax=Ajellomyces dermatitidis (strain ER-3 / ATCC MYA-2586) TaxID=559297 RepID=A0ABX2VWY9_AJEDR|nr:ubiquitin thiolesterase [Blastomyces dermatitidis ER-3]OAT01672.1 ubiquitin thiolesterase [Blastomyces dermatitidis ER-3]
MMNHHLPPMHHGQPPIPAPRRQHEIPYVSGPPNIRSTPGYMGYHQPHAHANGPPTALHPAQAQQYQHWYPYQQAPPPHPPPPQQFQPNTLLIVSSYPRSQPPLPTLSGPHYTHSHIPSHSSTTSSTPLQSSFSPTPTPPSAPGSAVQSSHGNLPASPVVSSLPSQPASSNHSKGSSAGPVPQIHPPSHTVHAPERTKTATPLSRQLFQPPLPWLSVPEAPFPARAPRRRRKARILQTSTVRVEFSTNAEQSDVAAEECTPIECHSKNAPSELEGEAPASPQPSSETSPVQPNTPSSTAPVQTSAQSQHTPAQTSGARQAAPIVPIVPIIPSSPNTAKQPSTSTAKTTPETLKRDGQVPLSSTPDGARTTDNALSPTESATVTQEAPKPTTPVRAPPKSWADLVRTAAPTATSGASPTTTGIGGLGVSKGESLFDVINNLGSNSERDGGKIAFIEPRGLLNTGNMCYMNSILQILVFCVPFYEFLDKIGRRAVHSFKSDLPLIDAMIMFMREFRVIDAATSVEKLRLRLKQNELELYGESFIPEYVYQVIRHLPRFRDMRRGHQQDAQEFLGFLLEELHDECTQAVKQATSTASDISTAVEADFVSATSEPSVEGWLEVGHKQKPAITRSSGHISAESPITKIFGGKLRSEFRVPGNKNSVTLEPYQSLQLDIGSPQVNNIIDALKGLTKPETMQGDFNSSRGPKVTATKQVFIESLPPVLILHLKRFQYDNVTKGTQKIWKKVGYPLELELPKEAFPPHRRNIISAQGSGLPKYRLTGVIYHHGKNASGGHYTVDVRRQDGREWIRLDDTVIRRVRSEDVANAGSEEDPKVLAAALEQHKIANTTPQGNIFEQFDMEQQQRHENEQGWSHVNGHTSGSGSGHAGKKSMAAVVNGTTSPSGESSSGKRTPSSSRYGSGVRDNKVAYLLFYQKI